MPSKIAPPKLTGGGGFTFEDKVCSWFLAHMLASLPPFDVDDNLIERIDFQTRPDGWFLDDVLLTISDNNSQHRYAISIKSNQQFSIVSAPKDFVQSSWEQFLHFESDAFNPDLDFLGLITSPLPNEIKTNLNGAVSKAKANDPDLLAKRYQEEGWANENERELFTSFQCPEELVQSFPSSDTRIGSLLKRCVFLEFDFESDSSEREKDIVRICREILVNGEIKEAVSLWESLLHISSDLRPKAGYISRTILIDRLRNRFELKGSPNHEEDWKKLLLQSNHALERIRNSIAGDITVDRNREVQDVLDVLAESPVIFLHGRSGVGKSVLAKQMATKLLDQGRKILWLDATTFERKDFNDLESSMNLDHSFSDLVQSVTDGQAYLVLDGLDRVYQDTAFQTLAKLTSALGLASDNSPWKVVFTCQTVEMLRIRQGLRKVNALVSVRTVDHECEPIPLKKLDDVFGKYPQLQPIRFDRKLQPILENLKLLDLIASRVADDPNRDSIKRIGESNVSEWFWEELVNKGSEGPVRSRFVQLLAEKQSEELVTSIPMSVFEVSELQPLHSLIKDRICKTTSDDHVAFEHDLIGDWVRLRLIIANSDKLIPFLKPKMESPFWHRAFRLYGIHVLETQGVSKWTDILLAIEHSSEEVFLDLFLESILFSPNANTHLENIHDILLNDSCKLLLRLLRRFFIFGTLPDLLFSTLTGLDGSSYNEATTHFRYPNWPYWIPLLQHVIARQKEFIELIPDELGKLCEMWLDHAPRKYLLRKEVAKIGLILAYKGYNARHEYSDVYSKFRRLFYRLALLAAYEYPDEVAELALLASGRRVIESKDIPEEEADSEVNPLPLAISLFSSINRNEPHPIPWPDGPRDEVDEEFRKVALTGKDLLSLFEARPEVVREIVLALLICRRNKYAKDRWSIRREEFEIVDRMRWFPPFWTQGPFLNLLMTNFSKAFEIINRLVDFTTERWNEYIKRESKERGGNASDEYNPFSVSINEEYYHVPTSTEITIDGRDKSLLGDERVYVWSAGLTNPPHPIEIALMSLEQYFYLKLEKGQSINEELNTILEKVNSVAVIKVLVDVGKKNPNLFLGPLLPILSSAEIFKWDLIELVQGRSHHQNGFAGKAEWLRKLSDKFHSMPHRKQDLRILIQNLLISNPDLDKHYSEIRKKWRKQLSESQDKDQRSFIEQLLITFDLSNYETQEHEELCTIYINRKLAKQQEEQASFLGDLKYRELLISFPMICNEILSGRKTVEKDKLAEFWKIIQKISELKETLPMEELALDCAENSLMGGLAVLFCQHKEWIDSNAEKKEWALDQVRQLINNPPARHEFDSRESIVEWGWDCFVAEILAVEWAENPNDVEISFLVSSMVFTFHYKAVQKLFDKCAGYRETLGVRFLQLRRLLIEWAFVSERVQMAGGHGLFQNDLNGERKFNKNVQEWIEKRVDLFTDGTLPSSIEKWSDCDDKRRFKKLDKLIKPIGGYNLDMELVLYANSWMGSLDLAKNDKEREDWITFWREALFQALARIKPIPEEVPFWRKTLDFVLRKKTDVELYEAGDDNHGMPYPAEESILKNVAMIIQFFRDDEHPELLWKEVLDLPFQYHYWIESFLNDYHEYVLRTGNVQEQYSTILNQMFEFLNERFANKFDTQRFLGYELWDSLLGIDSMYHRFWTASLQHAVQRNSELFEKWVKLNPKRNRWSYNFLYWLTSDAAEPIILQALVWLERAYYESSKQKYNLSDKETETALARLLGHIWTTHSGQLKEKAETFNAFKKLLSELVRRQSDIALDLSSKIGSF